MAVEFCGIEENSFKHFYSFQQQQNSWDLQVVLRTDMRRGSAALLSLYEGLDLLDVFEVNNLTLLQKNLNDLVCGRGLEVQQNLQY